MLIKVVHADGTGEVQNYNTKEFPVHNIPPIMLEFELPQDYPSEVVPLFKLTCPWLTQDQVKEEKGSVVLQNAMYSLNIFKPFRCIL